MAATTTPESGAAVGRVGQLRVGGRGSGGTHAAETLSPVVFFFKSVVSRVSTARGVNLTTYGMVEVALVT